MLARVGMYGGTKLETHDFQRSLAVSHAAEDLPLWEEIYRRRFPGFVAMHNHRKDGYHQRSGIDRSVILENSKQILIDEKFRTKDYGDIALEYLSDEDRGVPGWVCKPLLCDYIAYAIGPRGICYLLPVVELQSAWKSYGAGWIKKYSFKIVAHNKDETTGREWKTISVGVPPEEIRRVLNLWMEVAFQPVT